VISHRYRCIFIHIPRCAGSSVEQWIVGRDWWHVQRQTKHLLASQAKRMYARWWKSYFKFAIVREPVSRFISALNYASHFGLAINPSGRVDLSGYRARFGQDIVLEHDHRYYRRSDLLQPHHVSGAIFGNILDAEVDYIGRFETLSESMAEVRRLIGHAAPFEHWRERSKPVSAVPLPKVDDQVIAEIAAMCAKDYSQFGYEEPR